MKAAAKNRVRLLGDLPRGRSKARPRAKERRDARERPVVMLSRKKQRVDMRAGCHFDPLFEPDSVNKMQIAL